MTEIKLSVIKDEPNNELIEQLEHLLKEAKSGELQAIFYAASWNDNGTSHGWTSHKRNHKRIMGELHQMLHDLAGQ